MASEYFHKHKNNPTQKATEIAQWWNGLLDGDSETCIAILRDMHHKIVLSVLEDRI
jgi:hypothetical protein